MFEINWVSPQQKGIHITFEGGWSADEFDEAAAALYKMLSEVGHSVNIVIHITETHPIAMEMIPQFHHLLHIDHPNRNQMILVGDEQYLVGLRELIRRMSGGVSPNHLQFTDSLEAADNLLMSPS